MSKNILYKTTKPKPYDLEDQIKDEQNNMVKSDINNMIDYFPINLCTCNALICDSPHCPRTSTMCKLCGLQESNLTIPERDEEKIKNHQHNNPKSQILIGDLIYNSSDMYFQQYELVLLDSNSASHNMLKILTNLTNNNNFANVSYLWINFLARSRVRNFTVNKFKRRLNMMIKKSNYNFIKIREATTKRKKGSLMIQMYFYITRK